jgi:hypothetical protein
MTVTANNLKAITAAELRDGMTIQHPGSGQVLTVSDVKDDGTATGGKHWTGKIKGGDGHAHSFNAPLNFPLYQVIDNRPAPYTPEDAARDYVTNGAKYPDSYHYAMHHLILHGCWKDTGRGRARCAAALRDLRAKFGRRFAMHERSKMQYVCGMLPQKEKVTA